MNLFDLEKILEVAQKYQSQFFQGMLYTIAIAIGAVFIGVIISLVLLPLRLSRFKILKLISSIYVEIIRGTPIVVQIYIIYWGISPIFKDLIPNIMLFGFIDTLRYVPGIITIGINCGAYISEILRAGINAVDRGQTEASRSLGMTGAQTMWLIVLPQAIKNILPALANEFVTVIKESSILYVIGINELMNVAKTIGSATYSPMEGYIIAASIYFVLCFTTSKIIAYYERRMGSGYKR